MSGQQGELRVGGRIAGTLGPWILEGDSESWTFHTTGPHCKNPDDILLGIALDEGVELRVTVGKKTWRWKGATLERANPTVVRGTGRPEIR